MVEVDAAAGRAKKEIRLFSRQEPSYNWICKLWRPLNAVHCNHSNHATVTTPQWHGYIVRAMFENRLISRRPSLRTPILRCLTLMATLHWRAAREHSTGLFATAERGLPKSISGCRQLENSERVFKLSQRPRIHDYKQRLDSDRLSSVDWSVAVCNLLNLLVIEDCLSVQSRSSRGLATKTL